MTAEQSGQINFGPVSPIDPAFMLHFLLILRRIMQHPYQDLFFVFQWVKTKFCWKVVS